MTSIKDLYQWFVQLPSKEPHPPKNLTPLQVIEWKQENSDAVKYFEVNIKNKSFVGEILTLSPALVEDISINKIKAFASYGDSSSQGFDDGYSVYYELLMVNYELIFSQSLYEIVRLIHNNSMIEFEGEIIKFSHSFSNNETVHGTPWNSHRFNISLNITSIRSIKKKELKSFLIGGSRPNNSQCFIATAAFGYPDKTEVIQLREFRDKVLTNSIIGRLAILTYSYISPSIAYIIKNNDVLRKTTRIILRRTILPIIKIFS